MLAVASIPFGEFHCVCLVDCGLPVSCFLQCCACPVGQSLSSCWCSGQSAPAVSVGVVMLQVSNSGERI